MKRHTLVAALGVLALSACVKPPPPTRQESQDAAACRSRADEVFLKQNRGLLSERDQRDTPFASTGVPGNTTEGLGDRYGRDVMVSDCLNSVGPAAASTVGTSNPTTTPAVVGPH